MSQPPPTYPQPRKERQLVYREEGKDIFTVNLKPFGRCNQWLASFPNGVEIIGGMAEIHLELRKQMPPLLGIGNL